MKYIILLITILLFLGCSFKKKIPPSWEVKHNMALYSIDGLYENLDIGNTSNNDNITENRFVEDNRNALDFERIDFENRYKASLHNFLEVPATDINNSIIKYIQLKLDTKKLQVTLFDNNFNTLKTIKRDVTPDENNKSIYISEIGSGVASDNVLAIASGKSTTRFLSDGKYIYVKNSSFTVGLLILPLPLPVIASGNEWYRFKKIKKDMDK